MVLVLIKQINCCITLYKRAHAKRSVSISTQKKVPIIMRCFNIPAHQHLLQLKMSDFARYTTSLEREGMVTIACIPVLMTHCAEFTLFVCYPPTQCHFTNRPRFWSRHATHTRQQCRTNETISLRARTTV